MFVVFIDCFFGVSWCFCRVLFLTVKRGFKNGFMVRLRLSGIFDTFCLHERGLLKGFFSCWRGIPWRSVCWGATSKERSSIKKTRFFCDRNAVNGFFSFENYLSLKKKRYSLVQGPFRVVFSESTACLVGGLGFIRGFNSDCIKLDSIALLLQTPCFVGGMTTSQIATAFGKLCKMEQLGLLIGASWSPDPPPQAETVNNPLSRAFSYMWQEVGDGGLFDRHRARVAFEEIDCSSFFFLKGVCRF